MWINGAEESPAINSDLHGHYDKRGKKIEWGQDSLFNKCYLVFDFYFHFIVHWYIGKQMTSAC